MHLLCATHTLAPLGALSAQIPTQTAMQVIYAASPREELPFPAVHGRPTSLLQVASQPHEREFFIDDLLVRLHFIIVMIRWTGLAPWEFESPFPGSLTSTFLVSTPKPHGQICIEDRGITKAAHGIGVESEP